MNASRLKGGFLSSTPLYLGCHQKVPFRIRMGYSASKHPIKEIPHRSSQHLGFSLIPDAVRLTSNISYYRHLTCKVITKSVVEVMQAECVHALSYLAGRRLHCRQSTLSLVCPL